MTNSKYHDVFLGLGTNIGDKSKNIQSAVNLINERIGKVISLSSFYETVPVGFFSENNFLNAACRLQTQLSPMDVLQQTKIIEKEMGRCTKSENGIYTDRIIDIDMLFYDNIEFSNENLILPHPHLHEREFVLLPLSEIAFDLMHPVLNKTIGELKNSI